MLVGFRCDGHHETKHLVEQRGVSVQRQAHFITDQALVWALGTRYSGLDM